MQFEDVQLEEVRFEDVRLGDLRFPHVGFKDLRLDDLRFEILQLYDLRFENFDLGILDWKMLDWKMFDFKMCDWKMFGVKICELKMFDSWKSLRLRKKTPCDVELENGIVVSRPRLTFFDTIDESFYRSLSIAAESTGGLLDGANIVHTATGNRICVRIYYESLMSKCRGD